MVRHPRKDIGWLPGASVSQAEITLAREADDRAPAARRAGPHTGGCPMTAMRAYPFWGGPWDGRVTEYPEDEPPDFVGPHGKNGYVDWLYVLNDDDTVYVWVDGPLPMNPVNRESDEDLDRLEPDQ